MGEEAQRVPRLFTNNPFQGAALLSAAPLNPSPSAVGLQRMILRNGVHHDNTAWVKLPVTTAVEGTTGSAKRNIEN
jgi:hypothetical protein